MRGRVRDASPYLVVAAIAFAVRALYAVFVEPHVAVGMDRLWYEIEAALIADGKGVMDPVAFLTTGESVATAWRAPGFPAVLGLIYRAGGTHTAYVWFGVVLGAVSCVMTAIVGLRLAGRRVGVIAGALLAVHPLAVATDASVMSEVVAVPLVVGALWLLTVLTRPDGPDGGRRALLGWASVGAVAGALAWVRVDAVFVVAVVVVAAVGAGRGRSWRIGVPVAALVAMLVVAPWLVRNERAVGSPTMSTMAMAVNLAGANCESSWSGELLGYWDPACAEVSRERRSETEASAVLRRRAWSFVRDEWPRFPVVATVRVLRTWGLYDPADQSRLEAIEQRHLAWHRVGWGAGWLVLVLAAASFRTRGARSPVQRWSAAVLIASVVAVSLTVMFFHGHQRYRAPAEPALCIAAAITVERWVRHRQGRDRPVGAAPAG